jgi:hypothetical protein
MLRMFAGGEFSEQSVGWKTGPGGIYPLSLLVPFSNQVFWGEAVSRLFPFSNLMDTGGFVSLGVTAILVVWLSQAWRELKWAWVGFVAMTVMSFGPFLRILPGLDHGPIMPFWFFRFLPLLSGARMSCRWQVVALVFWVWDGGQSAFCYARLVCGNETRNEK